MANGSLFLIARNCILPNSTKCLDEDEDGAAAGEDGAGEDGAGGHRFVFSTSEDGGETWSAPRKQQQLTTPVRMPPPPPLPLSPGILAVSADALQCQLSPAAGPRTGLHGVPDVLPRPHGARGPRRPEPLLLGAVLGDVAEQPDDPRVRPCNIRREGGGQSLVILEDPLND